VLNLLFLYLLSCCDWNVKTIRVFFIHDKGKSSHFVNLILQKMQKAVKFWWWNCKFMATLTLSNQIPINLVKINNSLKKMKISSNIWSYLWHHYKFEKPGNLFHSNNIKSVTFWAKTIFKLRLFGVAYEWNSKLLNSHTIYRAPLQRYIKGIGKKMYTSFKQSSLLRKNSSITLSTVISLTVSGMAMLAKLLKV